MIIISRYFVSHGHYDHILDVGNLSKRLKPKTIICNSASAESLQKHQSVDSSLISIAHFGDNIENGFFKLEVVKGIHNNSRLEYERLRGVPVPDEILQKGQIETLKFTFHELSGTSWLPEKFEEWMEIYPGGDQLNYILTLKTGERIYLAGSYPDPEIIEDARGRDPVNLMLLQIMSSDKIKGLELDTFSFAQAARSQCVVPQHFDALMKGSRPTDMAELQRHFDEAQVPFTKMEIGSWYFFENNSLGKI